MTSTEPPSTPPRAWRQLLCPLLAAPFPAIIGAVVVQVVAAALSGLQGYAVGTSVNIRTNIRVAATDSGV
ncbi:hypothetical protein GGTG_08625 [Gaeumannomyces tritici R3-111a-1]|uniref:Uncharacterized protein n=1 Tax=Gaeumannomyces tritici (strain R3-111a-1) TaxID=644352 RepID=J3P539_GAET3|nr:hypothetical protein GGTG_08625 [Gaeumannomyces tritici R3-111a-1]EJT74787.1 hypothetical protein GGTG_08625 [Gaeumannomyces tritici R3-111a-1]